LHIFSLFFFAFLCGLKQRNLSSAIYVS
jgi:hypothetical protein